MNTRKLSLNLPDNSPIDHLLDCVSVDDLSDDTLPELAVICCHGFGAGGDDLVPLGEELLRGVPQLAQKVRFYFPAAPLQPAEMAGWGGRAWWPLDLEKRLAQIERGEDRVLRSEVPEGLDSAVTALETTLTAIQAETKLPRSRIILSGFSQGSMLVTHAALTHPEPPAALVIFSGTLICEPVWKPAAPQRAGLQTIISHGRQDPILPFTGAEWLRDMLSEAGLDVSFLPFNGQHTIPMEALQAFAKLLVDLTSG